MKTVNFSVLVSALFFMLGFNANAQDGNTILKKMDEVMYSPKDMTGKTQIILIDKAVFTLAIFLLVSLIK